MQAPQPTQIWGQRLAGIGACIMAFGMSMSLPLMTAGMGIGCLGLVCSRPAVWRVPGFIPLVAFVAWIVLAQAMAQVERWDSGLLYTPLGLLVVWTAAGSAQWRKRIVAALIAGVAITAILAMLQFFIGYNKDLRPFRIDGDGIGQYQRASGWFATHLTQGYTMAAAILVLAAPSLWLQQRRVISWGGRILAGLALLLAQARSGWMGCAAGLLLRLSTGGRKRAGLGALLVLIIGLSGAGLLALINPTLLAKTLNLNDTRWAIWGISSNITAEQPLFGVGGKEPYQQAYATALAQQHPLRAFQFDPAHVDDAYAHWPELQDDWRFQQAYGAWKEGGGPAHAEQYAKDMQQRFGIITGNAAWFPAGAPHAHNSALALASFYGIPAGLLWLITLLSMAAYAFAHRKYDSEAAGLVFGTVALALVAGQFEYYAGDGESAFATWLLLGLGLGSLAAKKNPPSSEHVIIEPPTAKPGE